jgi:hypothetical protein
MTIQDYTVLSSELEKNEILSLALKCLIDAKCSTELLSLAIEELCDHSESIKIKYMN